MMPGRTSRTSEALVVIDEEGIDFSFGVSTALSGRIFVISVQK